MREQPYVPWRVYRPGIVVGDSRTGEMDKVDGPYYFFKAIQRLRQLVPEWVPLVGPRPRLHERRAGGLGGRRAGAHRPRARARRPGLPPDRPAPAARRRADQRAGRRRARPALRAEPRQTPDSTRCRDGRCRWPRALPPWRQLRRLTLRELGIPRGGASRTWSWCRASTRARPQRALAGTPLEQPPALPEYASRLWDYWERDMDPDLGRGRTLREALERPHGADHRRLLGDRPLRGASRSPPPAASRCSSRATSTSSRRCAPRSWPPAAPPTCTPPTSPTPSRSNACSSACSPTTATSTCSSTTRAARSAARSRSATTASTTSNARCSSTTSARSS